MDELIKQAIAQKNLIDFDYRGLHRVAEPHVFGIKNGVRQALVYQIDGGSHSGKVTGWKRVDLHQMLRLKVLDLSFSGQRSFPSGKHSTWDICLAVVS